MHHETQKSAGFRSNQTLYPLGERLCMKRPAEVISHNENLQTLGSVCARVQIYRPSLLQLTMKEVIKVTTDTDTAKKPQLLRTMCKLQQVKFFDMRVLGVHFFLFQQCFTGTTIKYIFSLGTEWGMVTDSEDH